MSPFILIFLLLLHPPPLHLATTTPDYTIYHTIDQLYSLAESCASKHPSLVSTHYTRGTGVDKVVPIQSVPNKDKLLRITLGNAEVDDRYQPNQSINQSINPLNHSFSISHSLS
eukprot:TRINITY_DN452_c0_g4_i3.p1 TRINITY_DN452_c0_g4~~TRINITY_DN452_c0_g4_i3.p1  ORF type:complete len:114 (+),score=11.07 TRINITY_DN452_c0_g4_i3:283-624(+)